MTFKIVASQGERIVFDQRVEAASPREAREVMKRALRLESLTGLVYAITEIPASLIEEIVTAKMARVSVGNGRIDPAKLMREAAEAAVKQELAAIKNRLTALEGRKGNAGEAASVDEEGSKLPQRFDPTAKLGASLPSKAERREPPTGHSRAASCHPRTGLEGHPAALREDQEHQADRGELRCADQYAQGAHP